MSTWCTPYQIPNTDDLCKEMRRTRNVIEKGLFGTAWQFNFAPKLFCFKGKEKDSTQVDRVLAYSVPSEVDGQTVKFFICRLEQTVLTIKGVDAVVNMVQHPKN